jgi:hypothetical protein
LQLQHQYTTKSDAGVFQMKDTVPVLVILFVTVGHIQGRGEVHTGFWWGNLSKRDCLYNLCIVGMIILKWIVKQWGGGMDWIDLAQDGEYGNEPLGCLKCGIFLG